MKVYTRTGDKGDTRLIGNRVVAKNDPLVEAYGSIDELNSFIGMIIASPNLTEEIRSDLFEIQQLLFDCGTDVANADGKIPYRTQEKAITWLEERIDNYDKRLKPIESFILPGGTLEASQIQFARSIARRVERRLVGLPTAEKGNPNVLKYLNRLSDYLFVCGRLINHDHNQEEPQYLRSGKVFR
ncbi:cob(I)yrinic acid a,c-diamide adenosyltransferase [Facklamia miroungae]|uniref:Corrinoid adenosyltransferase n=1 Tax=Facklamia miroungae TaxID=120956 RepID=A0A1G7R0J6_9LACT|nr:cob(I)yrinic acid a,c-diamide adenosyltransferase [Facklamia miroungae]NKZ29132.1 cob(I)yrinic acid a,c-diamide adenosyltransferase [Facklamia miroungae]SDG04204.1 cob(I)alamin adenosyltransferase [Facklamia miroungae]